MVKRCMFPVYLCGVSRISLGIQSLGDLFETCSVCLGGQEDFKSCIRGRYEVGPTIFLVSDQHKYFYGLNPGGTW